MARLGLEALHDRDLYGLSVNGETIDFPAGLLGAVRATEDDMCHPVADPGVAQYLERHDTTDRGFEVRVELALTYVEGQVFHDDSALAGGFGAISSLLLAASDKCSGSGKRVSGWGRPLAVGSTEGNGFLLGRALLWYLCGRVGHRSPLQREVGLPGRVFDHCMGRMALAI